MQHQGSITHEDWEDLQKEARRVENEIDQRLLSYSSMISQFTALSQDKEKLDKATEVSESAANEIEELIRKVSKGLCKISSY